MIIIPIGTKNTLALKPLVTISLIVTCVVIHILSGLTSEDPSEKLITIYPDLYADQVHLYLLEENPGDPDGQYLDEYQSAAIASIRNARDFPAIEEGIYVATGESFDCIEKIGEFGDILLSRDESYYHGASQANNLFRDWKIRKEEEDRALAGLPSYSLGLVPAKMNRIWTFVTHLFLHGDIWHLLGNMLFLWVVGCLLEDSWGRYPFLAFYLAGGIFAGWAHCLQDTSSSIPLIGASGAIAAIMGAFTVRHFMTRIKFFYLFIFLFRPFWGNFYLPAFVFLPFWFFQQVALKSLAEFGGGGSEVAYLAHIAGYMAGIITALTFKATGVEKKWIDPMVEKKQIDEGVLSDPRFDEGCRLINENQIGRARLIFSQLLQDRPEDLKLAIDICSIYIEHGIFDDCLILGEKTLKTLIIRSRLYEATDFAFRLIACDRLTIQAQSLMRIGKWLAEEDRYGEAHDIYRYIIEKNESPNIVAKTSILLARILSDHLNNPSDAIELINNARSDDLDRSLLDTLDETVRKIETDSEALYQN